MDLITNSHCEQQDEYSRLSRNASLGVHGYALVFSIISRQSFEMIIQVNDSLLNTLGDAPDVPRVLVGSMKDLNDKRQVSYEVSAFEGYLTRLAFRLPKGCGLVTKFLYLTYDFLLLSFDRTAKS
jgi:GTPase SAR1 family protein